jgi:UDP-N-acetylglucosamine 2-epimerase (non-hydrolysing)
MPDKAKIHLIAAARPNFMKVAPLMHALNADSDFATSLVHTGQHYDANMSQAFFDDLGLNKPDFHLDVGSGSHAEQTGKVMMRYEETVIQHRPDATIVVGDVNSTAAVAMVCAKLHIPVVHLEAGLRSGDRTMPEEINRLVTDAISDLLWTPSPDGDQNLRNEGVPESRIQRVGNIMLDSFELMRARIEADTTREQMQLAGKSYAVVTLHRPANVDRLDDLQLLVEQLVGAAEHIRLVFPLHPRTRKSLLDHGLFDVLNDNAGVSLIEPLGYIQFMNLVSSAAMAITDSGGLQEETTYLGIPCLTLRPNTERPITISEGTNKLVVPEELLTHVENVLSGAWQKGRRPELWDGKTAGRCVAGLRGFLGLDRGTGK